MMNCHDATFLLSQRRERTLTFSERMKLRLHVGMCRGCTNFERQLPRLGDAAKAYATNAADKDV
ncbi:MAG: zf-HC2 domain-containing protein [Novosphingobium sp.]|jgi:hypothetical protein